MADVETFRRKPTEVQMLQWAGDNDDQMIEWVGAGNWHPPRDPFPAEVWNSATQRWESVPLYTRVARGSAGECFPVLAPHIEDYEPVGGTDG